MPSLKIAFHRNSLNRREIWNIPWRVWGTRSSQSRRLCWGRPPDSFDDMVTLILRSVMISDHHWGRVWFKLESEGWQLSSLGTHLPHWYCSWWLISSIRINLDDFLLQALRDRLFPNGVTLLIIIMAMMTMTMKTMIMMMTTIIRWDFQQHNGSPPK